MALYCMVHSIKNTGQTRRKKEESRRQPTSTLDSGLVPYRNHGLWDVVRGGDDVGGAGLARDALELDTLCEWRPTR